ncbi:MAG: tubulin-like doman-containing protein, partial [Bifidobacteriaceae bacterium]|nr:tubulin-like doman-containing protein [Bifidobacteriaceae bacterium]
MKIAPTLIIGLGGTGADIIAKVATKVNEGAQGQANRIQYVVFDTDTNGIQSIRTQFPQIEIVQTSTTDTVGEYLDQYSYARDNWFPINTTLNTKNLSEGAGQIRSISRLGFDTTLSAGNLKPLHNAIRRLFEIEANQEQQALKIIIVSSLAGGTGSGLILPVALYLRNYLKQNYRGSSNICRGFFIQPDIFYSVIPAAREQNTLGCNAYATVRELDAFIMKAEDTLPDKFKLLSLEFPSAGAGGRSEINVLPYDFCFLFDETNMNGGELSSSLESYKDHAATCIYAQSIGPMSKRSNSSEDNTRRDLTEAGGRNRYAGAGASRIYYPWEHIRDLVARQWAAECVSSQWLTFDHDFKRSQKQNRELLETEGIKAPDLILAKEYVRIVDERALNRDPFALAIKNQTQSLDEDGLKVEYTRFAEYVEHLENFAKTRAENLLDSSETDILKVRIEELRKSSDYELYANNYRDLQIYHEKVIRATEENARQIAFQIFNSDEGEDVTAAKNSHKLETYMRDTTNNHYLLPNSIRYFLYNVENLIKDAKRNV